MATIVIPNFDFTGLYYPDILEALFQFKRINVPELTDESPQEPFVQLIRAFALVGHLNNTLADMIANESTLPTAQLVETVRNMLRLIDYEMASATPGKADIVYELSQILSSTQVVVPFGAQVETVAQGDEPARPYENLEALSVTRTDRFTAVLRESQFIQSASGTLNSSNAGVIVSLSAGTFLPTIAAGMKIRLKSGGTGFPNRTAKIKSRDTDTQLTLESIGLRSNFTNLDWEIVKDDVFTDITNGINIAGNQALFAAPHVLKNAVYFGHGEAMWDGMAITLDTAGSDLTGVWEYYDGEVRETKPDSVTNLGGGQVKFVLNTLLGTLDRKGTEVRVQLDSTTAFEVVESEFDGTNNFIVASLLGQTTPSVDTDDYTVGSEWHAITNVQDLSQNFLLSGNLTFTLPQSLVQDWNTIELNTVEAFWLRFRIVHVGTTPVSPIVDLITMTQGKQYVKRSVTQGKTQVDDPLGSSDGSTNQRFSGSRTNYIDGSATLTVDDVEWLEVENFLTSKPTDRHYVVELGEDDRADFVFGDGVAGLIPPIGVGNIGVTYRHNAEVDGNVGANTITTDKAGLRLVNKLWNPRPAFGWRAAEGSTEESLARVKIEGPASLRVKGTALNGDDAVILATQYTDADGSRPFARGKGIEEGFGPKTVELVLVGAGGQQVSASALAALQEYFNGNEFASPPVPKKFVANQEVVCVNFEPKVILVNATVTVVANSNLTAQALKNSLLETFQPLAFREGEAIYEWEFGEAVPRHRIIHEIFATTPDVLDVVLASPAANVPLAARELPILDPNSTFTIVTA